MAERDSAENERYGDWRSLERAVRDAARKAARQAGPGRQRPASTRRSAHARFDRFLSRVFADGERSEWLLKGGMSMLARVPRSRTTKDMDLTALHASDLAEAERALAAAADGLNVSTVMGRHTSSQGVAGTSRTGRSVRQLN